MAPIKIGEKIPDGYLSYVDDHGALQRVDIYKLGCQKKLVIFGLPGAYTPVCSREHVPGYIENGPLLQKKGVEAIICLSVNDPFVMREWGRKCISVSKKSGNEGACVRFLADGSGSYTKALGMEHDLTNWQMGVRSRRYSLLVDNLIVKASNVEYVENVYEVSKAENILKALELS